jgi:antitoxin (DNA-binding transcriptional repressor) of toxin-antitoxin stability system
MPDGTAGTTGSDEMKAEDARRMWAALLSAAQWQGKHTVVTRSGKRAAVLVPPDWYDRAASLIAADDKRAKPKA